MRDMDEKVVEFTWLVCLLEMYSDDDIWQDIIVDNNFNIQESINDLIYELKYKIDSLNKEDFEDIEFYSGALNIAENLN